MPRFGRRTVENIDVKLPIPYGIWIKKKKTLSQTIKSLIFKFPAYVDTCCHSFLDCELTIKVETNERNYNVWCDSFGIL